MGYNSGIIILNDALDQIEKNPLQFTQRVVQAIREQGGHLKAGKVVDIAVGNHGNAAGLFHMAHADEHIAYLIGGNTSRALPDANTIIPRNRDEKEVDIELLKKMADAAGFRLSKKPKKQE